MKRRKLWGYYAAKRMTVKDGTYWLYFARRGDRIRWQYESRDRNLKSAGYFDESGKQVVTRSSDLSRPVDITKTVDYVRDENA
jgi:hypothetical protein